MQIMAESERNKWNHTASLNVVQAQIYRDEKSPPPKPSDFNPWAEEEKKVVENMDGFAALRGLTQWRGR